MLKLIFKDGEELLVKPLSKALNVLICKTVDTNKFLLVSRFALQVENAKEVFKLPKMELYE